MEDQDVVDRRLAVADRLGEGVGGMQRKARTGEAYIQRDVAGRDGARDRMDDLLPQLEVLEEVAWVGLDRHARRPLISVAPQHTCPTGPAQRHPILRLNANKD